MAVGVWRSVSFVVPVRIGVRCSTLDGKRLRSCSAHRRQAVVIMPVPVEHPDTGSSQDAEGEASG